MKTKGEPVDLWKHRGGRIFTALELNRKIFVCGARSKIKLETPRPGSEGQTHEGQKHYISVDTFEESTASGSCAYTLPSLNRT